MLEKPEKKFGSKLSKQERFLNFGFFGGPAIHGCRVRPSRPPKQAKNPLQRPKTCFGRNFGWTKKFYIVFGVKNIIFEGARPF